VITVGKRLQQARLKKQLSVDEAARATKVRADRIVDLENDTYANFPNLAYAKGFLIIYAKYLGVDVSDFTESFGISSPVGRNDYQYLANAPEVRPAVRRREGPAVKPMLILAAVAGILLAGAAFIMYLIVSAQRLGFIEQSGTKAANIFAAPAPSPAAVAQRTPLVPRATPALVFATPPLPLIKPFLPQATPAPVALATPALPRAEASPPGAAASPVIEVRRALANNPLPDTSPGDNPTLVPPLRTNEVVLQPLKKTWVTVRSGSADSPPVFEDWLYPDAKGLVLHGGKFWISVGEKGAVEIKKNGVPVNYDTSVAIE